MQAKVSADHVAAPLELIGIISNLRPQIANHLVGWGQAVRIEVDLESSALMPARPVCAGAIAIVVIQDATFDGLGTGR